MEIKNKQALLRQLSGSYTSDKIWIDPYTNERVWVFNPMHIVQLSTQTKSKFIRVVEGFKHFSNRWFSHVLLIMFLILYGFLGAYIFVTLEAPIENSTKVSVNNMREHIIKELWWSSQKFSKGWWQRLAKIRLKEFERQLHESCRAEQTTDSEKRVWNFWQALFFSSTIFTTIGYGHVVPKTDAGRVASIIYAFIGIPLLLMVLTDLGKLFTRGIKFVFKYCRKLYYVRQMKKIRMASRRATVVPTQLVSQTFGAANKKKPLNLKIGNDKENAQNNTNQIGKQVSFDESDEPDETIPDFEVDDEFNLPISVAVTLLLLYMMCGAAVFTIWEKWTFFESFYFVYISLSTIGFGDYVPEHPAFMMCTFIYLLFGLALTSMCINVVQEKLSATFQQAKLRIGATMGLDITQLMEEELNQDNSISVGVSDSLADKTILKQDGIGDILRERREKKRKASLIDNINKTSENQQPTKLDENSIDINSNQELAKTKSKTVDFSENN